MTHLRDKKAAVVIMAKAPRLGQVKTRLEATFSPEDVLALYRAFLGDKAAQVASLVGAEPFVAFTPDGAEGAFAGLLGDRMGLVAQRGGDLGERLANVAVELFARGHRAVILVDSDTPSLPTARLDEAIASLEAEGGPDVVLGPAWDGGYYLIGLRAPQPALFRGIAWSTATVLAETRAIAAREGLSVRSLAPHHDVDTPEDVLRLARSIAFAAPAPPRTAEVLRRLGIEADAPNAQQIAIWNEQSGPKWVQLRRALDAQLGPLGLPAMDRLRIEEGERVLDVGCGCGDTTLELARRVGPSGTVLGVDVAKPMLAHAKARAAEAGAQHARFIEADAQAHDLGEHTVDAVYSRFGVMFFDDPVAAFSNVRAALRPGGRLAFVCWRPLAENPWLFLPLGLVARFVEAPGAPAAGAPGPFAFADAARTAFILAAAGFARIAIEPHDAGLVVGGGGGARDAARFLLAMGPAGVALRDAGEAVIARVTDELTGALADYASPAGVTMPAATWLVTAERD